MSDARIVNGWQANLDTPLNAFLDQKIGAPMLSEMQRDVPVDTGDLRNSLDKDVRGGVLIVGSKDVDYSIDIELGTRNMAAQPFMKPALYKKRTP